MKTIIALLTIVIYCVICSCSPLKNHYLKKYCNNDTIQFTTTIHDTIIVDSIQVDSVFSEKIDSVYITKDKIEIQYVKKFGKIYLQGKCKGDTIYREKIITVNVPVKCEKLSKLNQFMIDYKWWIIATFAMLLLVFYQQLRH